ncbi:hypothetical protein CPMG_00159 [Prochlorococcus phage MED4-213]|uniref:Uncharacterized protein n=1 Tax=Prochlorococcus phage MED4-213 TaxID=889956 RepID=M4QQ89_9CAUD|nr:hypothetical protein CPMG_00159 [Prochlorococcus phage MED4-213]AGH26260.1 hypothetical protein CPMG_00159 [Prochlorococcus phage MED4-213]
MKTITTPTYLVDTCERIITMNNASPEMKEQCNFLLDWMQDRIEDLLLEKMYDEAYDLYMEWHEWVEIDDFTLITIRDEAK